MRILVFCAVGPRMEPETLASLGALEVGLHEVQIVLSRRPGQMGNRHILGQYQRARELALTGGYEALMTVESDMVVPPDALLRLVSVLEAGADGASGLYAHRHAYRPGLEMYNPQMAPNGEFCNVRLLWRDNGHGPLSAADIEQRRTDVQREMCLPVGVQVEIVDITQERAWMQAVWGTVIEVQAAGLGCAMFRRSVLEQVEFRLPGMPTAACDSYFYDDMRAAGMVIRLDMGLICGHKRTDGAILYPTISGRAEAIGGAGTPVTSFPGSNGPERGAWWIDTTD